MQHNVYVIVMSDMQGCEPGSSAARTRATTTTGLRQQLLDLMTGFQRLRQRLQDEHRREEYGS